MKLKYVGLSHERTYGKADFSRHGLAKGAAVKFDASNNWINEVDDEVGAWLMANEGKDFREATEEDETTPDQTRVGSPGQVARAPLAVDDADSIEGPSPSAVSGAQGSTASARRGSTARSST